MIRALVLVLALVLSGCMAEPFELQIDPSFSPGRQIAIQLAADDWLSAGASLGRIRVIQGDPGDPGWLGVWHVDGTITIRADVPDSDFFAVALHELGHAAAGTHRHHDGRGVMRADIGELIPCISRDDLLFAGLDGPGTCGTPAEPQR